MSEVKLKPCPFCGYSKALLAHNFEGETHAIFCPQCKAFTKWADLEMGKRETHGEFDSRWAERWNRRAGDE